LLEKSPDYFFVLGFSTVSLGDQMLKISDQVFDLDKAIFCAYISHGENGDSVQWTLEFEAKEKSVEDMSWKPHIIPHFLSVEIPDIDALSNTTMLLDDSGEYDEPMFLLYVYEHEPIKDVQLIFREWNKEKINFTLKGVANVGASEEYAGNLPIEVSLMLPFLGVTVDDNDVEMATERFLKFFRPDDFIIPNGKGVERGVRFRFSGR
jgi:hypothetical protein